MKKLFAIALPIFCFLGCRKDHATADNGQIILEAKSVASNPLIQWQKCLGGNLNENAYAVAKGSSGYLVAGSIEFNVDGYVSFYDPLTKAVKSTLLSASKQEQLRGVVATSDGFLVFGDSNSPEYTGNSTTGNDIIVAKISPTGDLLNIKAITLPGNQYTLTAIKTSDGGYAVSGYGDLEAFFVKLDAGLNMEGSILTYAASPSNANYGYGIVETQQAYIIGGITYNTASDQNILLMKVDKLTHTIIGKRIPTPAEDGVFGIAANSSNTEFVVAGKTDENYLLAKFDMDLNLLSPIKNYGGSGIDRARSIIATAEGYVIAGASSSRDGDIVNPKGGNDVWVLRVDHNLNKLSGSASHNFGGSRSDAAFQIIPDGDSFTVVGNTNSTGGDVSGKSGGQDMWMVNIKFPQ